MKNLEKNLPPNIRYEKCFNGSSINKRNNFLQSPSFKMTNLTKIVADNLNKRKFYLHNISKNKISNDVERYAFILTKINPASSQLVDEKLGKWAVSFNSDIGKQLKI